MMITGITDNEIITIQKSINDNLRNQSKYISEKKDTADQSFTLKPPVPMRDCLFVFQNSSHVAKCCRILAADILYNEITLTPVNPDADEHEINQIQKINEYLTKNIDELYNLAVDYYYAGWAALEYSWGNTSFTLKQIPVFTCEIIKIQLEGKDYYLLKQKINTTEKYFKIMGEDYPDTFVTYNGASLGNVSLLGGDNIYLFFSLPKWIQNYKKILTEIAIANMDYRTVSNGNISSGVLNINLEPQLKPPVTYDENGKPVQEKTRKEVISDELSSASSGTAVIFTESNRPVTLDYVGLTNNNGSYLQDLGVNCQQAVLNDYNIPLVRLMINTDKESMNSDKTKSIWEIYTLNLKNEQKPFRQFIKEILYELYSLDINVDISTPIFSDRREIEVGLLSQAWNDGALTLKQFITGLSEYIKTIDLNEYDFTVNPDLWDYRKLDNNNDMSTDDIELIESIEAQLGLQ